MSKVLVKFQADYADEFDVYGFAIYDKEQWEANLKNVKEECPFPNEVYFGTNEMIIYEDYEEYERAFTVIEVEDNVVNLLKRLFGDISYGHFCDLGGYF